MGIEQSARLVQSTMVCMCPLYILTGCGGLTPFPFGTVAQRGYDGKLPRLQHIHIANMAAKAGAANVKLNIHEGRATMPGNDDSPDRPTSPGYSERRSGRRTHGFKRFSLWSVCAGTTLLTKSPPPNSL